MLACTLSEQVANVAKSSPIKQAYSKNVLSVRELHRPFVRSWDEVRRQRWKVQGIGIIGEVYESQKVLLKTTRWRLRIPVRNYVGLLTAHNTVSLSVQVIKQHERDVELRPTGGLCARSKHQLCSKPG